MTTIQKTLKGLWSLIVGLKVTGKEFCRPWITVHYPRQEVTNLDTYRGHIDLVPLSGQSPETALYRLQALRGSLPFRLHPH